MLYSRSKGQIAQLNVELVAASKNYVVSRPSTDTVYDLIIDDNSDNLKRAQIKYCNRKHDNNYQLRLDNRKTKRLHYKRDEIDVLLVFVPKLNVVLKYDSLFFHKKHALEINITRKNSKWHYSKFVW